MKLPAAHAAQAPALRELQGILAKANKFLKVFNILPTHSLLRYFTTGIKLFFIAYL
jgi:hypothetical protein